MISDPIHKLPQLAKVASGEMFGLVASEYSSSFKGLLNIKEEISKEDQHLIEECSSDAFDPAKMFRMLNIDPALVKVPDTHRIKRTTCHSGHWHQSNPSSHYI